MRGSESRKVWRAARTFEEFGEAIALQLEGKLQPMPSRRGFSLPILPETKPLVPVLAALNRSGKMVTLSSQPGYEGKHKRQGVYVYGYVSKVGLTSLRRVANGFDLILCSIKPGGRVPYISVTESRYGSILGGKVWPVDESFDCLHRDLRSVLKSCRVAFLVDTEWGRNDVLWQALRTVI